MQDTKSEIAIRETIASFKNRRLQFEDVATIIEMIASAFVDRARQEFEECARSSSDDFQAVINQRARELEEEAGRLAVDVTANLDFVPGLLLLRSRAEDATRAAIGPLADRVILSRLKGEITPAGDRKTIQRLMQELDWRDKEAAHAAGVGVRTIMRARTKAVSKKSADKILEALRRQKQANEQDNGQL